MQIVDNVGLSELVGRDLERHVLEEALDEARHGRGHTVLITGEDGIGKSRLALEAARSGRRHGMRVLEGRTSPVGPTVALRPLAEALACLFRDGQGPDGKALGSYRAVLGGLVPEYAPAAERELPPAEGPDDAEPDASPVLLAESVLRLVAAAGEGRGSLLVLEDLHDADVGTLAVVEYLADNLARQGIVLLVTFRSGPGAPWDLARALTRRRSGTLLVLRRLDRAEVERLAASHPDTGVTALPAELLDDLYRDSGGNPFIAEELLRTMVATGHLAHGPQGHRPVPGADAGVPLAVEHSIVQRVGRLGPEAHRLLSAAGVIGERFPVSVLRQALGMTETEMFGYLRSAVAADLLTADGPTSDWYAFRGPMTVAALLSRLTPTDRAALAGQAAEAVGELHPGLPGEWCLFGAALKRSADDRPGAARLFAEAGRRALMGGRAEAAVGPLTQAWELLDDCDDTRLRADVLAELMSALAASGRTERGLGLAAALDELGGPAVDAERVATLHTRLAWLYHADGQRAEGLTHVEAALTVLGPDAEDRQTAQVEAVWARLIVDSPERAQQLATQAVGKAERAGLPALACLAWQVRGLVAQQRGSRDAALCFDHMQAVADGHGLPLWRMRAMFHRAGQQWLVSGDRAALVRVRRHAGHLGATALRTGVDLLLSLDHVLRGEYTTADALTEAEAGRAVLSGSDARFLTAVRAISAAHQGRLDAPEHVPVGGEVEPSPWTPLTRGLGEAVRALLAEDRDRARLDLADAAAEEAVLPAPYPLAGQYGLALLLDVLAKDADWPRYHEVAATEASQLRWNRHFLLLAKAVLLGREGRGAEAAVAREEATALGEPYVMAAHLGLRLVAEAACADHWGEPVRWLRRAEEYFHQAGFPVVARVCRTLLRRTGVVVPQRVDAGRVPQRLRFLGVTEREYEVLLLMTDRPDNRSLAARLFISPRTVEKHVASLILKTDQPNRAALNAYAARIHRDER
ncbi:LuxR family transcriptional regulator [Streptomyces sp. GESEQ-35]|uniref:helix-turn-helix transcriptional regulator n=1 Tax=Streptomyces sp. GESEQ-35 TaxID=2812657 RepID=UPI001B33EA85|nr:LuxR family transcriptional regulator [Streptomyces sp. GESEQ-35]